MVSSVIGDKVDGKRLFSVLVVWGIVSYELNFLQLSNYKSDDSSFTVILNLSNPDVRILAKIFWTGKGRYKSLFRELESQWSKRFKRFLQTGNLAIVNFYKGFNIQYLRAFLENAANCKIIERRVKYNIEVCICFRNNVLDLRDFYVAPLSLFLYKILLTHSTVLKRT